MLDVVQGKLSDANARIVQLEDKLRMAEKGLVVSQQKKTPDDQKMVMHSIFRNLISPFPSPFSV